MLRISKTRLRWIQPMLLTIGAILLLCSLLLGYTLNVLRQNMLETSRSLTQYLQQNTDAQLLAVQKHALTLELNPVNNLLKQQETPVKQVLQAYYSFGDQMHSYRIANKLVRNVFIYYPKAQLTVGSQGCYAAESYYALQNGLTTQGFDQWRQGIEAVANGFALVDGGSGEQFCYIRSVTHKGQAAGYIVFQFDTDALLRGTSALTDDSLTQVAFGILCEGQLFASTGDRALLEGLLETGSSQSAVLHRRPSDFPGIDYVNVYLQRELLQPFSIVLWICVAGVVTCGLFGILASLYIGRRNAAPLRSLMTKLGAGAEDCQDEYQLLGSFIDRIMQERNLNEEKLLAQQNVIGSLFLNGVLSGEMHNEYAIFNAAKRYDVLFEYPYYLVGVMSVCGPEGDGGQCMSSLLQWTSGCGCEVTASFYQGKYVLLFNLSEEQQQHSLVPLMQELMQQLSPKEATAALGQRFDSLVGISLSYGQALTTLRQAIPSSRQVVCYSNIVDATAEKETTTLLPLDALSAALQQKRFAAATEALESLVDQHSACDTTQGIWRIQFAALQNQLLETLYRGRQEGLLTVEDFRSRELLDCTSWGQLRSIGARLLGQLQRGGTPVYEDSSIAERAKSIINQDFTDPMLGLYLISDKLQVSNSYLSTTFKSKFGIGLVQYINQLRINEAKSLIQSTDLSIKEIALMVGFSCDISFIRVFKRYESQTPNSLRKHI